MNELTTGWKLFRLVCIIQMIIVAFELILSVGGLFGKEFIVFSFITSVAYLLIFVFVYQGLSLINYNYPDTPLSVRQKKIFNWLFLLNFLLIALLFGQIVNEWRALPIPELFQLSVSDILYFGFPLIISVLLFIFHIIFLIGMYNLRRLIYHNTIETWQEQFSDTKTN